MMEYTPKQIVAELSRYIIGQDDAKKSVAVALRNRYRRSCLTPELRDEITPKNILMKGPTGVGKTEIARRLAKIIKAPFVKVEATKFTEVGYVGRDVESMIRDLVECSIRMVKEEEFQKLRPKVESEVNRKLVDILFPEFKKGKPELSDEEAKALILKKLIDGDFDNDTITFEFVAQPKNIQIMPGAGNMELNLGDMLNFGGKRKVKKTMKIKDAKKSMINEECEKHLEIETINAEGLRRAEQDGIIFIDEIDKIASRGNYGGADVSREGVQRDILPIVEGCTVSTKYGPIKTDFILFIAAGAFHIASVDDLIPELQGRFPVRVELTSLTQKDFIQILTATDNCLLRQYAALLKVDHINLKFTEEAINRIAFIAQDENENSENLGARRLSGIMEALLEDISFEAGNLTDDVDVEINLKYVDDHIGAALKSLNLKKYII